MTWRRRRRRIPASRSRSAASPLRASDGNAPRSAWASSARSRDGAARLGPEAAQRRFLQIRLLVILLLGVVFLHRARQPRHRASVGGPRDAVARACSRARRAPRFDLGVADGARALSVPALLRAVAAQRAVLAGHQARVARRVEAHHAYQAAVVDEREARSVGGVLFLCLPRRRRRARRRRPRPRACRPRARAARTRAAAAPSRPTGRCAAPRSSRSAPRPSARSRTTPPRAPRRRPPRRRARRSPRPSARASPSTPPPSVPLCPSLCPSEMARVAASSASSRRPRRESAWHSSSTRARARARASPPARTRSRSPRSRRGGSGTSRRRSGGRPRRGGAARDARLLSSPVPPGDREVCAPWAPRGARAAPQGRRKSRGARQKTPTQRLGRDSPEKVKAELSPAFSASDARAMHPRSAVSLP